jgi:hypothetical protein
MHFGVLIRQKEICHSTLFKFKSVLMRGGSWYGLPGPGDLYGDLGPDYVAYVLHSKFRKMQLFWIDCLKNVAFLYPLFTLGFHINQVSCKIYKNVKTEHLIEKQKSLCILQVVNFKYAAVYRCCNLWKFATCKFEFCKYLLYYKGADKPLARPTSQCILFDGENILFDASLVLYI